MQHPVFNLMAKSIQDDRRRAADAWRASNEARSRRPSRQEWFAELLQQGAIGRAVARITASFGQLDIGISHHIVCTRNIEQS